MTSLQVLELNSNTSVVDGFTQSKIHGGAYLYNSQQDKSNFNFAFFGSEDQDLTVLQLNATPGPDISLDYLANGTAITQVNADGVNVDLHVFSA